MIASSCGYPDAKALLIGNVDYLVNSIGLKLNNFDITPQVPQVLLMMTRLCGMHCCRTSTISSPASSMRSSAFTGYPQLVGLLFMALSGVVEEGIHAPVVRSGLTEKRQHLRPARTACRIEDVVTRLKERARSDKLHWQFL
ncbi:hypothetical protein MRB53_038191 [Persea americana]|nr:hypothetical protein MRB53_038191 [Persea americana]